MKDALYSYRLCDLLLIWVAKEVNLRILTLCRVMIKSKKNQHSKPTKTLYCYCSMCSSVCKFVRKSVCTSVLSVSIYRCFTSECFGKICSQYFGNIHQGTGSSFFFLFFFLFFLFFSFFYLVV